MRMGGWMGRRAVVVGCVGGDRSEDASAIGRENESWIVGSRCYCSC